MIDEYICTDLASECREHLGEQLPQGVQVTRSCHGCVTVCRMEISGEDAARALGKPMGCYTTVSFDDPRFLEQGQYNTLCLMLADEIRWLMRRLCPGAQSVLVAGLGNRRITADALGPQTVDRITVTRHLQTLDPTLFEKVGQLCVAALTPGVLGDTGVEAAEMVKKSAETVKPDLILAVDALAARSVERLGCTVQLADSGIAPGSGVGNRRMALSQQTVGVPVIAIGVPTVVNSATLVRDALTAAGYGEPTPELREVLESGRSFFVTPKDSDASILALSELLSAALDMALTAGGGKG